MGKWVHQAFLGVDSPSVDELGRHSSADIRHIPTWFLLTHYLFRWSTALVEACFLRILHHRVDCHDALSPTEVVRLDVFAVNKIGCFAFKQDSNASVEFSLKLFHVSLWIVTIWQISRFLRLLGCLLSASNFSGSFRFEQTEKKCILICGSRFFWEVASSSSWTIKFIICLKLMYHLRSNSWSSLVSVVTVPVACSASVSFVWHHGFGIYSSSFWCYAGPFNYPDSLRILMDLPLVPLAEGFSVALIRLRWPI